MTKESIIQKHWPKPSESDSIPKMQEAIKKMMDEWAKIQSVKLGHFLITASVSFVELKDGEPQYKTNIGFAPDMLIESMEEMYDRVK